MSILIKGMKMPQSCSDCRLNYDQCACSVTGTRWYSDTMVLLGFNCDNERLQDCPLVELPDYHGRLIDGDDIKTAFPRCDNSMDIKIASVRATINHMPSIIEAEGEDE